MKRAAFYFALFAAGLLGMLAWRLAPELTRPTHLDPALQIPSPFELASLPVATRFDFPLGSEHGALAYNAQRFTENHHLGDDLNGIGGENSDLGDPIYAVADGRVLLARDAGSGWGNVIIILHAIEENGARRYVQSYYGHCDEILVAAGNDVRRGQKINPIQGEKRDDGAANEFLLARGQSQNAQARPVHDVNGERIDVEERQRAIKKEGERVPLKCGEEMGVKKCDGRSRRTAGQA